VGVQVGGKDPEIYKEVRGKCEQMWIFFFVNDFREAGRLDAFLSQSSD
jgi:hypothetical protein